jgi:hypothetical protein
MFSKQATDKLSEVFGTLFRVTGTNYVDGCKVLLSGAALVTAFVSAGKVAAVIPAASPTAVKEFTLKVKNLDGGESRETTFKVT